MSRLIDTEPRRFSWRQLVLEPVLAVTNLFFWSWFWIAKRTSVLRVTVPPTPNERLLLYSWHKHSWILWATMGRLGLPDAAWVAHDGFLSMMVQRSGLWSGTCVVRFSLRSPTRPTAQIVDAMRANTMHLGVATDSGGPYGEVKPGLIAMAQELGARLVPMAVHTRGAPRVGKVMRHELPAPFMRVSVELGEPLPKDADVAQAQQALERLETKNASASH